jgi:excisionase family DNA binding protein
MTLNEAAERLATTGATLRIAIHRGKLHAVKVGRDWHVSDREVELYRLRQRETGRKAGA